MRRATGKDGPNRLTILGGQFGPERLGGLPGGLAQALGSDALAHLGAHQRYCVCGSVGRSGSASTWRGLWRGRAPVLRRDGQRWFWHYIGPADPPAPAGFEKASECEDFWAAEPNKDNVSAATTNGRYFGAKRSWMPISSLRAVWWEDRVALARLDYPVQLKGHERIYLRFGASPRPVGRCSCGIAAWNE